MSHYYYLHYYYLHSRDTSLVMSGSRNLYPRGTWRAAEIASSIFLARSCSWFVVVQDGVGLQPQEPPAEGAPAKEKTVQLSCKHCFHEECIRGG